MTYELRNFEAMDLRGFDGRTNDRADLEAVMDYDSELLNGSVVGRTGFLDGYAIGMSGIIPIWPGRAQAFAFYAKDATLRDFSFMFRATKRFLDETQKNKAYRRIEATVLASFEKAHNYIKHLGFKPEGRMELYDLDGRTHTLYSRIRYGNRTLLSR
jgi:RimJ/RimL family protein N-acetyltransferase